MDGAQLPKRVAWPSAKWWAGLLGIPAAVGSSLALLVPRIIEQPWWIRYGVGIGPPLIIGAVASLNVITRMLRDYDVMYDFATKVDIDLAKSAGRITELEGESLALGEELTVTQGRAAELSSELQTIIEARADEVVEVKSLYEMLLLSSHVFAQLQINLRGLIVTGKEPYFVVTRKAKAPRIGDIVMVIDALSCRPRGEYKVVQRTSAGHLMSATLILDKGWWSEMCARAERSSLIPDGIVAFVLPRREVDDA